MRQVTKDEVLALLTDVVSERGASYRYRRPDHMRDEWEGEVCLYWHTDQSGESDGAPGCIAGQAFHRLGISGDRLKGYETRSANYVCENNPSLQFHPEASWVLRRAQAIQDAGLPWGVALAHCDHVGTVPPEEFVLTDDEARMSWDGLRVTLEGIDYQLDRALNPTWPVAG